MTTASAQNGWPVPVLHLGASPTISPATVCLPAAMNLDGTVLVADRPLHAAVTEHCPCRAHCGPMSRDWVEPRSENWMCPETDLARTDRLPAHLRRRSLRVAMLLQNSRSVPWLVLGSAARHEDCSASEPPPGCPRSNGRPRTYLPAKIFEFEPSSPNEGGTPGGLGRLARTVRA